MDNFKILQRVLKLSVLIAYMHALSARHLSHVTCGFPLLMFFSLNRDLSRVCVNVLFQEICGLKMHYDVLDGWDLPEPTGGA